MHSYENVTLTRDVDATRIPSGEKGFIPKGTEVTITQVLGGTYTVQFIGGLARIEGKDADALGKTPEAAPAPAATPAPAGPVTKESLSAQVWTQLKAVLLTIVWSGVVSVIAFKIVDLVIGLRVSEEEEREGLDITSHGETAYHK